MAATAMTPAQLELIDSLSKDDIPTKLRCAICSKLAINAFRLPCCEQAICSTCQAGVPESCPVCEHSPVTPDDCTPYKGLRTTIKVFLRTEEKKRGALLAKAAKETPPDTPIEAAPSAAIPEVAQEQPTKNVPVPSAILGQDDTPAPAPEAESNIKEEIPADKALAIIPSHDAQDIPHESIEVRLASVAKANHKVKRSPPGQAPNQDLQEIAPGQEQDEERSNVDDAEVIGEEGEAVAPPGSGNPMLGMGMGGAGMAGVAGGMNPMMGMMAGMNGMGGEMNQMQQMQMMMAMQGGFGGFGMMGMPGMPIDPMAMQSMYMGGMGAGIGMNNMGSVGGYEAQNWGAWNAGGDNFNTNIAAGTNHNDFGSVQYPNRGGFNRGGFGGYNGHQPEFYGRGRGRGRGRGGFGRGGWQGQNDFGGQGQGHGGWGAGMNGMGGDQMNQMTGGQQQDVPKDTPNAETKPNVDEFGREIRAATPDAETGHATTGDAGAEGAVERNANIDASANQGQQNGGWNEEQNGGEYNDQGSYGDWSANQGYNQPHSAHYSGAWNGVKEAQPVDVPINAPTGPKAMREGLPNVGLVHLQGRKGSQGRPYSSGSGANGVEVGDRGRAKNGRDDREGGRDGGREAERDVMVTGERDRYQEDRERESERRERRERRHRDENISEDEKESERRRERRRRRREEAHAAAAAEGESRDTEIDDRAAVEGDKRARSASPTESKRGSRREEGRGKERSDRHSDRDSHRHRERSRHREKDDKDRSDRDRERSDRDKDGKSSRSDRSDRDKHDKHRSSRRDRDRSRSRSRDRKEDDDKSRSRRGDRERERDSDRDGHRRRYREEEREQREQREMVLRPPTGPKSMSIFDNGPGRGGGIQIKGKGERGKENLLGGAGGRTAGGGGKKEVDPHTAEREARNRERLLKEAQRMAGLVGVGGVPKGPGKRERDTEVGGRRKRRGKSGGFGGDGVADGSDGVGEGEGEEERIRRGEREREGARGR